MHKDNFIKLKLHEAEIIQIIQERKFFLHQTFVFIQFMCFYYKFNKHSNLFQLSIEFMNFDIRQLQKEIVTKTLDEEIIHKEFLIQQIEKQFTFNCNICKDATSQVSFVKYSRKTIGRFEKIIMDFHSYFLDLRIGGVFNIFYRMFKIMILGFKTFSEMVIVKKKNFQSVTQCSEQGECTSCKRKDQEIKQLKEKQKKTLYAQQLDFIIKQIEKEEQKLCKEKNILEKQMVYQKKNLANIGPADTVNKIKQLKEVLENLIDGSENLINDDYLFRHQQLQNFILKIKKPSSLKQSILKQISDNLKNLFIEKINGFICQVYLYLKRKQVQSLRETILGQKPVLVDHCSQTMLIYPQKQIQKIKPSQTQQNSQKEKKMTQQIQQLKNKVAEIENELKSQKNKYFFLEEMIKKKNFDADYQINDLQWNISKKEALIHKLYGKIEQLKNDKTHWKQTGVNCEILETQDKEIQTQDFQKKTFQQLSLIKQKSTNEKKKQNQLKKLEQSHQLIKKRLKIFYLKLNSALNKSLSRSIEELFSDINSPQKDERTMNEIEDSLSLEIKLFLDQKQKTIPQKHQKQKKRYKTECTQTQELNDLASRNRFSQFEEKIIPVKKNEGKLDRLKKELISKIVAQKQKQNDEIIHPKTSGREKRKDEGRISIELRDLIHNETPKKQKKKVAKKRNYFKMSKKQITFQEIKLDQKSIPFQESTRNHAHENQTKRLIRQKKDETLNSFQNSHEQVLKQKDRLLHIQNSNIMVQLNHLLTSLFKNKDYTENTYRGIMMFLLKMLEKQMGSKFVKDIFTKFWHGLKKQFKNHNTGNFTQ